MYTRALNRAKESVRARWDGEATERRRERVRKPLIGTDANYDRVIDYNKTKK